MPEERKAPAPEPPPETVPPVVAEPPAGRNRSSRRGPVERSRSGPRGGPEARTIRQSRPARRPPPARRAGDAGPEEPPTGAAGGRPPPTATPQERRPPHLVMTETPRSFSVCLSASSRCSGRWRPRPPAPSAPTSRQTSKRANGRRRRPAHPAASRKGVRILAELFALTDDGNYIFNQARCYQKNGRSAEAIARFEMYLAPSDAEPAAAAAARQYIAELQSRTTGSRASSTVGQLPPCPSRARPRPPVHRPHLAGGRPEHHRRRPGRAGGGHLLRPPDRARSERRPASIAGHRRTPTEAEKLDRLNRKGAPGRAAAVGVPRRRRHRRVDRRAPVLPRRARPDRPRASAWRFG